MKLSFYNSLTRKQEEFVSLTHDFAGLYTCGPTVYNFAHIGNFRAYVFEDILRRSLEFAGYQVKQVMNLTDVDDKTIRGALSAGITLKEYTKPYIEAFFEDLKTLNIESAEVYPAATDHIPEMISLIEKLFEKGLAYQSDDKSVYFSVGKLPKYGQLAHVDPEQLRSGVRINADEYEKESFGDFAVWKAWDEKDGDVAWDSPWGKGRPGWHLECSAMSMKYLGETFDLHTGGIDNLFPHHENEIAQAEGATGQPFVKTWLHCAHLRLNGEKMSKSLGNFYTLRDLVEKGYSGREIRYVLIGGQYRQPLNFTFESLAAARTALLRVDGCTAALKKAAGEFYGKGLSAAAPEWAQSAFSAFKTAIGDDLNTPGALAALFTLIKEANIALTKNPDAKMIADVFAIFEEMDKILGVIFFTQPETPVPLEVIKLLAERTAARAGKNWAESDRLRDEIAKLGYVVCDGKNGATVKRV